MNCDKLVIYRKFKHQELFDLLVEVMTYYEKYDRRDEMIDKVYQCVHELLTLADRYGLEGNLVHSFLGFLLATNENSFSTTCEILGPVDGSINYIALNDFGIFKELFDFNVAQIDIELGVDAFSMIQNYVHNGRTSKVYNKRVRDLIHTLTIQLEESETVEEYYDHITAFYKTTGVGKFGLHKAFRLNDNKDNTLDVVPITSVEHIYMDDLVGYEIQKKKIIDNTEAFVCGMRANNVLLYGDSGTGKSSCIKAILNQYYDRGLRMIEVYKHQFEHLSELIELIKDRNYKFIIYMDDLSFEDFEIEYKYLKAIIEGGLGKKPDNVLIYATSNRRHLVREKFSDKEDRAEDLHTSDTVQEKLSLVARFGVTVCFVAPGRKEFMNIVKELAKRYQIDISEEELYLEANKWELSHGGLSGRTAQQFIDHLASIRKLY